MKPFTIRRPNHQAFSALFLLCLAVISSTVLKPVLADDGDTVDPTFNCPAFTTCKQVCVPEISQCPLEMLCNNNNNGGKNETLCPDGTCSESCEGHEESPCPYECAPVACNKVDNFHDNCTKLYRDLWDAEEACGAEEIAEATDLYTYKEPGFILCYVWCSVVPVLIVLWCAYNQRLSPVPGSCKELDLDLDSYLDIKDDARKKNAARLAWQTGYKFHPVGMTLYFLTIATILGIYTLLMWLVIQYYIQQEAIWWWWVTGRFDDEVQVLLCFILIWMYGFIFIFSLKFPHSIKSIHLRRCDLAEADFVAVAVKRLTLADTQVTFSHDYMAGLKSFFASFHGCVHVVMTFLFSDKHTFGCERKGDTTFAFRPVMGDRDGTKYITFEFRRYNLTAEVLDGVEQGHKFVPGAWMTGRKTVRDIFEMDKEGGLSFREIDARRRVVGYNRVEMERPSFLRALKHEFSTPFYTYQIFMVFSWIPLWYYYMAFTWSFVILVGAITVSVLQFRNERNLYRMTQVSGKVKVLRNGEKFKVSPDGLVPGDIVSVRPGLSYCDMVVIKSNRLVVDESALTGEANPVGKVALDPRNADQEYNEISNKASTIFAGTTILETSKSRAVVMKTASYTARGELIRDIFSYKRQIFKFDTEIPIVVTLLFFYACIGWGLAYSWTGDYFVFGWFYGMFVVAGCLPPLLPTVFTVSVGISDDRLAKKKITCTNSESILVAGKVDRAFFDKTGTITKQGLDFLSAVDKDSWDIMLQGFMKEIPTSQNTELKLGMACCHSLVPSDTGVMIGNYVDQVMFAHSEAQVDSSGPQEKITNSDGKEMIVVKRFDFDHHRMTQSVIVRDAVSGDLTAFCKGSGEAIRDICRTETLPNNLDFALKLTAKSGIYQISLASKPIPRNVDIDKITRDEIESGLYFQGVINFKNLMREEAPEVIRDLRGGDIISTMVTGDNVLTGICIAREAGIITEGKDVLVGSLQDETVIWMKDDSAVPLPPIEEMENIQLAISGAAWRHILISDPKQAAALQDYIRVFGRCTPLDKVSVIQGFVRSGHITLMAGDGGNDCGALKAAHVGVALSEAEASIVAPFTSLEKEINSVVSIIREGRCALGSALASYKFVILYGQILTINQLMAAYFYITFSEWGWVFMDGIWTITLSFALPLARASKKLAPTRPTASILGLQTLSSAIGVLVLNFIFVVIAFLVLYRQDWFQCRTWEGTDVSNLDVIGDNYETQVLWLVTGYQVINSATVFNFGYEFRQAWICNWILVLLIAGFTAIHFYITLVPGELSCFFRINCLNEYTFEGVWGALPIQNDFNTTVMPESFRRTLIGIMVANTVATVAWDFIAVNGTRRYYMVKRRQQEKSHQEILESKNNHQAQADVCATPSNESSEEVE